MTYDKETRAELMEDELREDKIKEVSNEIDDGSFETWKENTIKELSEAFLCNNENFEEFCRDEWREHNEGLI